MKTLPSIIILLCCISSALSAGTNTTASAEAKTAAPRPRAMFASETGFGRDPFFPMSTRRGQPRIQPSTNAPVYVAKNSLALKGISGTKQQPLAIINNTTLAEGEVADIRAGAANLKVLCVKIGDASVLVEIVTTKQRQELKLRDGI